MKLRFAGCVRSSPHAGQKLSYTSFSVRLSAEPGGKFYPPLCAHVLPRGFYPGMGPAVQFYGHSVGSARDFERVYQALTPGSSFLVRVRVPDSDGGTTLVTALTKPAAVN